MCGSGSATGKLIRANARSRGMPVSVIPFRLVVEQRIIMIVMRMMNSVRMDNEYSSRIRVKMQSRDGHLAVC